MKSWLIICSIYQATFCKIHILGKKKYSLFNTENHFLRAIILRRNSMIQDVKKMIEMVLQAWRLFSLLLFLLCQKFRHQKLTLSSASNCASHTSRAITLKGHTSLACLPTFLEGWDIQAQVPGNGYFFFLFNTIVKLKFRSIILSLSTVLSGMILFKTAVSTHSI